MLAVIHFDIGLNPDFIQQILRKNCDLSISMYGSCGQMSGKTQGINKDRLICHGCYADIYHIYFVIH